MEDNNCCSLELGPERVQLSDRRTSSPEQQLFEPRGKEVLVMDNYSYSRADAIADGVLVDVTEFAREVGFKFPVAITERLFNVCNEDSDETFDQRCTRVLNTLLNTIRFMGVGKTSDTVYFDVHIDGTTHKLWSVCGPGDTAEPVITIMFTDED